MLKRAGAIASTSVLVAIVGSALMAGAVSAKPTKSATIDETSPCNFTVTYSYSGLGHGDGLTVHVALFRQEAGTTNQSTVDVKTELGFSGNGAAIVPELFTDSGQTGSFQYIGYAYLTKGDRLIRNSQAWSELTSTPETCA